MSAAIITGGGGALGKGIASVLSAAGWKVVLADLLEQHALEVSDELGGLPWKVLDVTKLDDVRRVFAEVAADCRAELSAGAGDGALAVGGVVEGRLVVAHSVLHSGL